MLRSVSSLDDALAEIKAGWFPDVVIVYQGIPDEFPQSQIDELIGLLPLTRFVVAFGPWCESIGRTEQRWPIVSCVPIQHVAVRLLREFSALENDEPATPPTASRDEAFSLIASRLKREGRPATRCSALILGSDAAFTEVIREQLVQFGATLVTDESRLPDLIFVTATLLSDEVADQLSDLKELLPAAKLFLVSDLLTPGDVEQLCTENVRVMSQRSFGEELLAFLADSGRIAG